MKMSEAFPSKWVQCSDLRGQDRTATIHSVQMELVGQPAEQLPVVYFQGTDKGLVLNKTNGNTIAELLGDDTDMWGGQQITLYPTTTEFSGKIVPCIRVRSLVELANNAPINGGAPVGEALPTHPPAHTPPPQEQVIDDEIPF